MAGWRESKALLQLLAQVNARWPHRSKVSDGELGDLAHSQRKSDHNPNAAGVVQALDITNDPNTGPVSRGIAEALIASRDPRIKYVISNRQICAGSGGPSPWVWRKYTGANPHEHHVHISVKDGAKFYDDTSPWNLDAYKQGPAVNVVVEVGSTKWIQQELNKHGAKLQEDGHEGPLTQAAIRAYAVEKLKGN